MRPSYNGLGQEARKIDAAPLERAGTMRPMGRKPRTSGRDGQGELVRTNLVRFREELDLSQEAVATRAGVSVDSLRRYEQGRGVDALTLKLLADAVGHAVDHFFMPDPPPSDPTLVPAFIMRVAPGVQVDTDLCDRVRTFLDEMNKEHLERTRHKRKVRRTP